MLLRGAREDAASSTHHASTCTKKGMYHEPFFDSPGYLLLSVELHAVAMKETRQVTRRHKIFKLKP